MRTLTNTTSKPCPYGICGGDGILRHIYLEEGQEVERFGFCKCTGITRKQEIKKRANIPLEFAECTINSFSTEVYGDRIQARAAKKAAANYVKNFRMFQEKGKGLYLFSRTKGSGKTRLACSIGNALIQTAEQRVKFMRTLELLEYIKGTYNRNGGVTEQEFLRGLKESGVLILDDIGAEKPSEWVDGIFLSLLDYRISNRRPTIFTSNILMEKLRLDERIVDRIYKLAIEVRLPEESVRRREAKAEGEELERRLYDE